MAALADLKRVFYATQLGLTANDLATLTDADLEQLYFSSDVGHLSSSQAIDATLYMDASDVLDLASLVTEMETTGKAAQLPAGDVLLDTMNVGLNSTDRSFTYVFKGANKKTRLIFPLGFGTDDWLFRANVDGAGVAINEDLMKHPEIVFEDIEFSGANSPDAGVLTAYNRSVHTNRVAYKAVKYGIRTDGYTDFVALRGTYAEDMTAGGWVYEHASHGDALLIDGFMAYSSAGMRIHKCQGADIRGVVSGWHEFSLSSVTLTQAHLEGDGPNQGSNPVITVKGCTLHIPDGFIYTRNSRNGILVDDTAVSGVKRSSKLVLGRSLVFRQRLDSPGSTVDALQGVAIHIAELSTNAEIVNQGAQAEIFHQTSSATRLIHERLAPRITSDVAALSTVLAARPALLGTSDWEIRYRNAAWELCPPEPLGSLRGTRRATAVPSVVATGGAVSGVGSNLAAATYYYVVWSRDSELRDNATSAEVSAAVAANEPVKLDIDARVAPTAIRIARGTAAGVYTHWVQIVPTREIVTLFDQGDAIAGVAWTAGGVPARPTVNGTYDGWITKGGRAVIFGSAAPTTGTWAAGDQCLQTAPAAGGKMGFICTTAGSPGTWKPFGAIDA